MTNHLYIDIVKTLNHNKMKRVINKYKKIQLFLICLKSLECSEDEKKSLETIFMYQLFTSQNSFYLVHTIISYLFIIYSFLVKPNVHNKINQILVHYTKNQKSAETLQYIKRVIYQYYKYYNLNQKQKIEKNDISIEQLHKIAILYLYIMQQILLNKNLFPLYKYLSKSDLK